MIIEFFGLPGSGKTVNMKALLDHFGSDARQVLPERGVLKNGGLRLVFSAEFLTFLRLIVGLWLRKKRKVRYDLRTLYHFSLLYLACMKRRGDESVRYYLLDHGLVQSVSSLVWDEPGLYAKSGAVLRHFERYFAGSLRVVFTDYADIRRQRRAGAAHQNAGLRRAAEAFCRRGSDQRASGAAAVFCTGGRGTEERLLPDADRFRRAAGGEHRTAPA